MHYKTEDLKLGISVRNPMISGNTGIDTACDPMPSRGQSINDLDTIHASIDANCEISEL